MKDGLNLDNSTQVGGMNARDFYEQATQPSFPDVMDFQIRVANPKNDGTFSREGIQDTIALVDNFVMARTLARWRKTGRPPKVMRIEVEVKWEEDPNIADGWNPYFDGDVAGTGLTQIDIENLAPRKTT